MCVCVSVCPWSCCVQLGERATLIWRMCLYASLLGRLIGNKASAELYFCLFTSTDKDVYSALWLRWGSDWTPLLSVLVPCRGVTMWVMATVKLCAGPSQEREKVVVSRVLSAHLLPQVKLCMRGKQPDIDIVWRNFPLTAPLWPSITQTADSSSRPSVRPPCDTQTFFQFKIWYWWSTASCCSHFEPCWGQYPHPYARCGLGSRGTASILLLDPRQAQERDWEIRRKQESPTLFNSSGCS